MSNPDTTSVPSGEPQPTPVMDNTPTDSVSIPMETTVEPTKYEEQNASHSQTVPVPEEKPNDNHQSSDFMATDSIGKVMWKLTYPNIIAKVVSAMYSVCDTIFIGKMAGETQAERDTALAAVTLAMPLEQGIIHSIVMMISNGGSTLYGRFIGEKNEERGKKTIGNTYFLEIVAAIIIALIFPFLTDFLLGLLGASESANTLTPGREYSNVLFYGCICYAMSMASVDLIRGQGSAIYSALFAILSATLNMIGDPFYIKVCGMGVAGAALSTVLANLVSGILGIVFMRSKKAVMSFQAKDMKPEKELDKKIILTGMSGLVSGFAGAFVTLISNKLVLNYSKYPEDDPHTVAVLGAWGALSKVYFISFMPLIALSQGVMPMLAYSSGAKLHKRFMDCAKLTFKWMMGITVVIEAFILIFTPWIATWFSDNPMFIEFFVPATRIVVSGVFLQPFVMAVFPMLQAVGKGGLSGMLLAMKTCFFPLVFQLVMSMILQDYWGAVYSYPVVEVISAIYAGYLFMKNKGLFTGEELPIQKEKPTM